MKSQGSVGKRPIPELGQGVCEWCQSPGNPRHLRQWDTSGAWVVGPQGQSWRRVSSGVNQVVSDCSPEEM